MKLADPGATDQLRAGQIALDEGDWGEARRRFEAVLERDPSPQAWEGLGWACWWLSDSKTIFRAREEAFRGYRAAKDPIGAARVATWIAADFREFRGDVATGRGWLERAHRLLDDAGDVPERGWLAVIDADFALNVDRDFSRGLELASEGEQLGRRLHSADLEAVGLALCGSARVGLGELERGMRDLEEAAATALGERLHLPLSSGWTMCCIVSTCDNVGDFGRASEWCTVMRELAERWGGRQMLGVCRASYGRVLATRGEWQQAEQELTRALEDFEASRPSLGMIGMVRLGELRVRQGRTEEARELFERAGPAGLVGLGELALVDGDAVGAAELAERVLRRLPHDSLLDRLPPLELLARARAALGERDAAEAALAELAETARPYSTPYVTGRARMAAAAVAHAAGDEEAARLAWEDAIDCFEEGSAPYEAARARVGLAETLAAQGRADHARSLAQTARETFERLGASGDAERVAAIARGPQAGGLSGAHRARARGPAPGGCRPERRGDRRAPRRQPPHGAPARRQHPHEAAPPLARGRRRLCGARGVDLSYAGRSAPSPLGP